MRQSTAMMLMSSREYSGSLKCLSPPISILSHFGYSKVNCHTIRHKKVQDISQGWKMVKNICGY